jgi:hypothetical protein
VIEVRRLGPGDEDVVAVLAEGTPPDAAALLRDERTIYLYASVGGVRPNDDDVMWDFDYTAG